MSSRTQHSELGNESHSSKEELDFTSPGLAVMELRRLLFTGRFIQNPANEVWPRLYIGSMTKYSEWRNESRSSKVEVDFTSPGLAVMEVERLLFAGRAINSPANEVWPRLYIGNMDFAENRSELRRQNFTHVLNCAHSTRRGGEFYDGMGIMYLGIDAHDSPAYDMSVNFTTGAEFIHNALRGGGKILVHCHVGVSRSATIVLAYLMLKHNMTLVEAINTVKEGRGIIPNRGFLRQLIDLHIKLYGYRT